MVPGVRIRNKRQHHTIRRSIWCELSSYIQIVMCSGIMIPMIFPKFDTIQTNLTAFELTTASTTNTITHSNALHYYLYYCTSSKLYCIQNLHQPMSETCILASKIHPIETLLDTAESLGRIRTHLIAQSNYRSADSWYINDPILGLISCIVAISSSCILWSRFYRWKFTIISLGFILTHCATRTITPYDGIIETIQSILRIFGVWYMKNLNTNPIITKSLSAGSIGTIADYIAQWLEHILQQQRNAFQCKQQPLSDNIQMSDRIDGIKSDQSSSLSVSNVSYLFLLSINGRYDVRRGVSTLMDSLFISGPLMHLGYELFEWILPISHDGTTGWIAAILHVIADSLVLDSFFVASKFFTTGLLEGICITDLLLQFQSTYIPSLKASWVTSILMCPVQFSCFCYLPLNFRVLSVNVIDVVWDAVLSYMTHRSR
jgi:hypothetical protein